MIVRDERESDFAEIRAITVAAFAGEPHSRQTEAAIIEALRGAGALTVSLVAVEDDQIVGHIALSPVSINGNAELGWYGGGPLAVRPDRQRCGIGSSLVRAGLARLVELGAQGCVLVGDPVYYGRFGFRSDASLVLANVPPEFFQVLTLGEWTPSGTVAFHPAFAVEGDS
jgi:putative acetyltransferase